MRIERGVGAPVEIAISDGSSAQSTLLTPGEYIITTNLDVAFVVGEDPTATSSSRKLWAYTYRYLTIDGATSMKVAAVRLVSSTGTVSIERLS